MELNINEIAARITGEVTEKVVSELGAAITALSIAVRAQPGIDNDKLTEDMEEFLSRYSAQIGKPIPYAWKYLRLQR